jgi:NAD(P)-dependent dehydrogenase (short-subunit alcohol dehydrogenase family)
MVFPETLLGQDPKLKHAHSMAFTRALGGRSLDANIRVVGINPGPVETFLALDRSGVR